MSTNLQLEIAHASALDDGVLDIIRAMLVDVFEGDFDEHDWEHALGGMHVVGRVDGAIVAHGSAVMRRLLHGGRALRCGYVEAVGVRADHRRRGHGDRVMRELERIIDAAFDIGALGASDDALVLYQSHGWKLWEGPTSALTPAGVQLTPDSDGAVMVLSLGTQLDFSGELTCDWREGDVW